MHLKERKGGEVEDRWRNRVVVGSDGMVGWWDGGMVGWWDGGVVGHRRGGVAGAVLKPR